MITHTSLLVNRLDILQTDLDFSSEISSYRIKTLDNKPLLIPGYIDDVSQYEEYGLL